MEKEKESQRSLFVGLYFQNKFVLETVMYYTLYDLSHSSSPVIVLCQKIYSWAE